MAVFFVSSVAVAVRAVILTDRTGVLSSCKSAYTAQNVVILLLVDVPLTMGQQ